MKKIISLLFLLICISSSVQAQIITGGVEMSVEDAREEVFENRTERLDVSQFFQKFKDKNCSENKSMLLRGITELKDRRLAIFSDGSYAVMLYDDKNHSYYYAGDGNLLYIEKRTGEKYPFKAIKYSRLGAPLTISLKVSEKETFVFNPNGKLLAHWIGEFCYDENKNVIMSRKIYK